MRVVIVGLVGCLLAWPLAAQPIAPLTGTTGGNPTAAEPPVTAPPPATGTPGRRPSSGRKTLAQRFEAANTTHDGKLTKEQARAGHLRAVVRDFDQIDTAKRGYVTLDEIRAHMRTRAEERRARRQAAPQ